MRPQTDLDAAGITDPALRAGYLLCRRINARHGKTYFLATLLLPPAKRPYVHALYGFARYADDIVDGGFEGDFECGLDGGFEGDAANDRAAAARRARFTAWSERFLSDLDTGRPRDPVHRAALDTVRRWDLPTAYFADFLAAMRTDLDVTGYPTYADLERYMWGSAAVIGLQMLPILGRCDDSVPWRDLEGPAADLGLAFQLTNFLRDVGEDLRRGRVYLPEDSLAHFGVDRERLARGVVDAPIRDLLAAEVDRARGLYRQAEPGIALVHPTSQDCLRTALTLYRGILDEIEQVDYDVFSGRVTVARHRRLQVGLTGLGHAWTARRRAA